jgi:hypothetical protein
MYVQWRGQHHAAAPHGSLDSKLLVPAGDPTKRHLLAQHSIRVSLSQVCNNLA